MACNLSRNHSIIGSTSRYVPPGLIINLPASGHCNLTHVSRDISNEQLQFVWIIGETFSLLNEYYLDFREK